jgi:oligoendopeptidase F
MPYMIYVKRKIIQKTKEYIMTRKREEIENKDCWDVEALYPTTQAWKEEYDAVFSDATTTPWNIFPRYQGRLHESSHVALEILEAYFSLQRIIEKLYTYAHLRHDEEITNDENKTNNITITTKYHDFSHRSSWLEPEFLSLPEATIKGYMSSPELSPYIFRLEKIFHRKKHTLPSEQEALLALSQNALDTASKSFGALNNADISFDNITDGTGEERPLSHATYSSYLHSQDRVLRCNAFTTYHNTFLSYENSLCELLSGAVQKHLFDAKARSYDSCLSAALFPKNIDNKVYHALVDTVDDNVSSLHKYISLRKKILGYETLHLYDMYVPLIEDTDITMPFDEATDIIVASVQPLGEEYKATLRKGLHDQRWADKYENVNKRSGAYSSGCYDSHPYILMNYEGSITDIFTLAHEAGHSMHTHLSGKKQPYHYADYPIFLAEIASTFNEELLFQELMRRFTTPKEQLYLVNQKLERIRATLFRQTMFATFELMIHTYAEKGKPLTPQLLKEEYSKLNARYFGEEVVIDDEIAIEWARIPHFYYNFYVYQYSTGISAAQTLVKGVIAGDTTSKDKYLKFLESGGSRYPLETLKKAGVDMTTPQPVKTTLDEFVTLTAKMEELHNATQSLV